MTVKGVELVMARRQVEEIIRRDTTMVSFIRRPTVKTPSGGWKYAGPPVTLDPQPVAMIPFKRRMTEFLKNTELGPVSDLPYTLVGRHDLDVQAGDTFIISLGHFEVAEFDLAEPEVKTAVQVDYYGGGSNA